MTKKSYIFIILFTTIITGCVKEDGLYKRKKVTFKLKSEHEEARLYIDGKYVATITPDKNWNERFKISDVEHTAYAEYGPNDKSRTKKWTVQEGDWRYKSFHF